MNDILCPTDFTPAAAVAQRYATAIAAKSGSSITPVSYTHLTLPTSDLV